MPTANYHPNTTVPTDYSGAYASAFPEIWLNDFEKKGELSNAFAADIGSPKSSSIIWKRMQGESEQGLTMHFRTVGELRSLPRTGTDKLKGYETKMQTDGHSLTVDQIRFGTAIDTRSQAFLGILGSNLPSVSKSLLSEQWNWFNMEAIMLKAITDIDSGSNVIYPSGASSLATLRSAHTLDMDLVRNAKSRLLWQNAMPTKVTRGMGGGSVAGFHFKMPTFATFDLKADSDYQSALENAFTRGVDNPIFSGDIVPVDGCLLQDINVFEHSGVGPIGSPWQRVARLGAAIDLDSEVPTYITGGGSDNTAGGTSSGDYFAFFSNAAFKFHASDTISADTSTDRYCAIINPPDATTDPGKIMFVNYRVNSSHALTIRYVLSDQTSGTEATTVGQVKWNGGGSSTNPFYGKTTKSVESGALIVETNEYGVPFGYVVGFGAGAIYIGHGRPPLSRASLVDDYENEFGYAVQGFWGICAAQDRIGRRNGLIICPVAMDYSAFGYPNDITTANMA